MSNIHWKQGVKLELLVKRPQDLMRRLFLSEDSKYCIKEADLEVESCTVKEMSVEDVIAGIIKETSPHVGDSVEGNAFLVELQRMQELDIPWTLTLEDPSGEAYISTGTILFVT